MNIVLPRNRKATLLPHVFMANLSYGTRLTETHVQQFTELYGPLFAEDGSVTVQWFRELQEDLREAWRRGDASLLWHLLDGEDYVALPLQMAADGLSFRCADTWAVVRLLLAQGIAKGHAKVCANLKRCKAPFFLSQRTDTIFCSRQCASDAAVRRFRARQQRKR
jgi:hypothetical protein